MVGMENNGNSVNRRNGADVMCGSNSSGNGGLLVLVCWDVNAYLDGFQVRAHTVYALSSEVGSLSEPPVSPELRLVLGITYSSLRGLENAALLSAYVEKLCCLRRPT
jgi:hypothetical protein